MSSQWNPSPVKATAARSAGKVMMVIFFDHAGFIYQYVLPQETTATKGVYLQILKHYLYNFAKKNHPQKHISDMLLYQDNARPHVAHTVLNFLTSKGIQLIPDPCICLILHSVTSSYSLKGKPNCVGGIFSRIWG